MIREKDLLNSDLELGGRSYNKYRISHLGPVICVMAGL